MILSIKKKMVFFFVCSVLMLLCSSRIVADQLKLIINNQTSKGINVKYVDSNYAEKFAPLSIASNKKADKKVKFSNNYILSLNIFDENDIYITNIQIVNNHKYSNKYKNIVPGNGPLPTFTCSWNNRNRIIIKNIEGFKYFTWITFSTYYNGTINIKVIDPPILKTSSIENCPAKFTLFATQKNNKLKNIKLNTLYHSDYKLDEQLVNLAKWKVKLEQILLPVVYKTNNTQSRWVDLIIHNYSMNTYLLYGLSSMPKNDHISFSYKQPYNKNNIIFYPPLTQLRGPGFKFTVKKEKNKTFTFIPDKNIPENKKDKYYLAIGMRTNVSNNILEYISIEIKTGIEIGSAMNSGVNISAYKNFAYQASFYPVNVSFYINLANNNKIKNLIRIPLNKNGEKAFSISSMKDIKIKLTPQSSNLKKSLCNKSGIIYEISGKSSITGKEYKYRLILIAPAFLAGNTPGLYSPNSSIAADYKIGNFIRYPIHLYVIPVNKDGYETEITQINNKSDLPSSLQGSIDYFISDNLNTN
ncbi:MAG: hypothetical protein GY756_19985 [bacterium]|nr:hypothetical protein [bacterium]